MANPSSTDWAKIKRIGRYLIGRPRLRYRFEFQRLPNCIRGLTDSDWAGCRRTRKSTSGAAIVFGNHLVQPLGPSLGFVGGLHDMGYSVNAVVEGDSAVSLGIVQRRGLGKLRHIQVQFLWIQGAVRDQLLKVRKIPGAENPADLLTKHVPAEVRDRHLQRLCVEYSEGRHSLAPKLAGYTYLLRGDHLLGEQRPRGSASK